MENGKTGDGGGEVGYSLFVPLVLKKKEEKASIFPRRLHIFSVQSFLHRGIAGFASC